MTSKHNSSSNTPLYYYSSQYDKDRILLKHVENGNLEGIKNAIHNGADPHCEDDYPFVLSAQLENLELVKFFHHLGANINAKDHEAIFLVCENETLDILNYLIEHKANICAEFHYCLLLSCNKKYFPIIHTLMNAYDDKEVAIQIIKNYKNGQQLWDDLTSYIEAKELSQQLDTDLPIKTTHNKIHNKTKI